MRKKRFTFWHFYAFFITLMFLNQCKNSEGYYLDYQMQLHDNSDIVKEMYDDKDSYRKETKEKDSIIKAQNAKIIDLNKKLEKPKKVYKPQLSDSLSIINDSI